MIWWGRMQRPKASIKTLLAWDPEGGEHWRAAPHARRGCAPVVAVVLSDPACRDCSFLPVQRRVACCDLTGVSCLPCRTQAARTVGKALLLYVFTDLSRSPSMNLENWVKISKLCVCHGMLAPYHNAFAVLKGWKHCLSKLEQTLLEKAAGTAGGRQFQSTVL